MPTYEIFVYTTTLHEFVFGTSKRYKVFVACLQFIMMDGNGSRTAGKLYQYIHTGGSLLFRLKKTETETPYISLLQARGVVVASHALSSFIALLK
jgi:hypothetical protein